MAKRGVSGAIMRGLGAKNHDLTVVDKKTLAPNFVQVRMASPTLLGDLDAGPTAWLRFWFPDAGDGTHEYQRGYTITHPDPSTGEFNVNFVLHEPAGPGSAWAKRARPGDTVQAMIYGSTTFEVPDQPATGYLLIGDSASMPAIASIIEVLPPEAHIECYLEEHGPDDHEIPLPEHRTNHPLGATSWPRVVGRCHCCPRLPGLVCLGGTRVGIAQGTASTFAQRVRLQQGELLYSGVLGRRQDHGHSARAGGVQRLAPSIACSGGKSR